MPITIKSLPGPKGVPFLGNIFKIDLPNLHKQIEEWADEFGDVYRLDLAFTNQMVVTRPSLIQKICSERPDGFIRIEKLDTILKDGGIDGVFNAEGDKWKKHRSIVAKGLDVKHQEKFYPLLIDKVEKLRKKWLLAAETAEPFDIQKDFLRFTVDVTASLAFGYEINTIEQQEGAIQDQMELIFPMIFKRLNDPIPWYKLVKSKADKKYDIAVLEMNKLVDEFIQTAKKKLELNPELKENPSNLIESIIVAAEEEGGFTNEEVKGNLLTLLMAGEDTTAQSLTWMTYLIAQHDTVMESIKNEVDEVLGDENVLSQYASNSKLKYIEAVMNESLRFKPVAPILLHQAIKDFEFEGVEFKKGQKVLTQYRHAALREQYFSEARKFYPERWMKDKGCPIHSAEAFTPFGAGPRFCPGRNLAILEVRAVIAMLFKNFKIELVTKPTDVDEIMAFTLMSSSFLVKLSKRD
jgi:cytochrome P450